MGLFILLGVIGTLYVVANAYIILSLIFGKGKAKESARKAIHDLAEYNQHDAYLETRANADRIAGAIHQASMYNQINQNIWK